MASAGQETVDFDDVMLERHYDPALAYHRSKLAQIMTAFDLAQRLPAGVTANAIHPSTYMPTKLLADSMDPTTDLSEGVEAVLALALDQAYEEVSGEYINVNEPAQAHPQAYDEEARERLREVSERAIREALAGFDG